MARISVKWLNLSESQLPNPNMEWELASQLHGGNEVVNTRENVVPPQDLSFCQLCALFSLYCQDILASKSDERRGGQILNTLRWHPALLRPQMSYLRISVFKSPFREKGFHESVNC